MDKDELKNRLKKAMDIRELTQADLVKRGGFDKGQLSSWLSGKYKPRQNNIAKLSEILFVDEAWLMGYNVPMERKTTVSSTKTATHALNKNEIILISEYRKLNDTGKIKLLNTAKEMNCNPLYNSNYKEELAAAHERTDIKIDNETIPDDIAIMNNPSEWE